MSRFIDENSRIKVSSSDILSIAAEAKKDKKSGNKVIDGSIGAFLNDDKTLGKDDLICQALVAHITDNLAYPPILGPVEYRNGVLKWLFKEEYEKITADFSIPFGATLGGTGACSIAFDTFLGEGDKVLLPDIMWRNYILIAANDRLGYQTYELFNKAGHFNIDGLREQIEKLGKIQKRVLALINDPCQNPTGYCLSQDEYLELNQMLQEEGKKYPLTVLFDIAYIDYDRCDGKIHPLFNELVKKGHSYLPCFAFSCSKSFGVYGLRCGALFALCEDQPTYEAIASSIGSHARGVYSCPNGAALSAISLVLNDQSKQKELVKEIGQNAETLKNRGEMMLNLLNENGIGHLPYCRGFFITICVEDSYKTCEKLKKLHTYLVPLDEIHIRISLASLTEEEMVVLAKQIKEAI